MRLIKVIGTILDWLAMVVLYGLMVLTSALILFVGVAANQGILTWAAMASWYWKISSPVLVALVSLLMAGCIEAQWSRPRIGGSIRRWIWIGVGEVALSVSNFLWISW